MKLQFSDEFTLEYEEKTLSGSFLELTRKQIKAFNKKYKDNEDVDSDALFKERLELSIVGDYKAEIMAIGEEFNYKIIFETIIKDIVDKKAGN